MCTEQSEGDSKERKEPNVEHPTQLSGDANTQPTPQQANNTQTELEPESKSRWWHNPEWWLAGFEGVLIPVGIIALIIYGCQLEQMRKATDAATEATKSANENARLDQRAWVTVKAINLSKPLAVGENPSYVIFTVNSGKTPALKARITSAFFPHERLTDADIPPPVTGPEVSRMVIGPGATPTSTGEVPIPMDAETLQALRNKETRLYVRGFIEYTDIFEKVHYTHFCFWLNGPELDKLVMHAAEIGNTAD